MRPGVFPQTPLRGFLVGAFTALYPSCTPQNENSRSQSDSGLGNRGWLVSLYRFELATADDDADLRRVMAETPMPGAMSVAFRREPSYFGAAVVDGRFRQVVVCREADTGRVVGFGSRSVGERYVNGRPASVGYLSSLRLLEAHRNRGLVARGYAYFRQLHADGR